MKERAGAVKLQGNPFTLLGDSPEVGKAAPDFTVLDNDLNPVGLGGFKGKVLLIASVPSLDTPVCDLETHIFNEKAAALGERVQILTVSMDLPFAQKRWCGAAGIDKLKTVSDHREASFGLGYGVLIKELRLLARAVFVVDAEGVLRYSTLVEEIATEPDYEAVLDEVKKLL